MAPISAASRDQDATSPSRSRSRTVRANGRKRRAIARPSATETERILTRGIAGGAGPPPCSSRLGEKAQLQGKLYIVGTVGNPELLLDALLVGINRFWTDEQLLTNFRRGIPLGYQAQHVLLA